ncbi:MAG: glycosyltransferase [Verrucomicrobiae bacterium]|nr:glycosyltransferase [Verrucomicrobiae bacterium]
MPEPATDRAPKILEIGSIPYLHEAFPQTTDFYSTWPDETLSDPARGRNIVSAANLAVLARRLADPGYDLVAVQAAAYSPWSLRGLSRLLLRREVLRGSLPLIRAVGPQLLRGHVAAPVAVLDLDDPAVIDRSNIFLLDQAAVYFKRELPADHWQVFNGTLHWRVPTPRFRSDARHRERIGKLRPISLGIPFPVTKAALPAPLPAAGKTVDVFFAGRVQGSSTVRERGLKELLALRAEGLVVDVPESPLAMDEYLARCARAWLVWSPAGYGWQCFRTCEAALCGSVPLVNQPTIEQHRPLIAGEHAFYYDVEPGGLARAVRTALADRDRLMTMAAAAREHVLAWHTPQALARYIVETTLQMAGRTGAKGGVTSHPKIPSGWER